MERVKSEGRHQSTIEGYLHPQSDMPLSAT